MSLVHKTLRTNAAVPRPPSASVLIRSFSDTGDGAGLVFLAEACRGHGNEPPVPATVFAGVLAGRPGRDVRAWVAQDEKQPRDGQVLGFAALVVAPPRLSVGWLLVHPAARRSGVGTALVDRVIAEAALLGAREVHVDTLTRWPAAVAFWERMSERHSGR